jgi:NADPH:quinone reductase-like Zn-dependent oxidoreductase
MLAAVSERYGDASAVAVRDVAAPVPGPGEVLVRVHAASVNSWDWDRLTGVPRLYRLLSGLRRPTHTILGSDYAGRIESVGPGVEQLAPGAAVFGDVSGHRWGAFAEYLVAPVGAVTPMPAGLAFEQAAALPQAGALAAQGLRALALVDGDALLINGGGGGTGALAIQLARRAGARVTAVDRPEKLELMRSLGAEQVVDFTREDFAARPQCYDAILDVNCHRSLFAYRRVMKRRSRYALLGGDISRILQLAALLPLLKLTRSERRMSIIGIQSNAENAALAALVAKGELSPVIDHAYGLHDTAAALQRIGDGEVLGKLVIHIHEAREVAG